MISITLPNLKLALWDLHDQSSFGIVDLSSYASLPTSGNYAMQITAPGYQTVNVTFAPGNVNIYKCADLGITCGPTECCPLPDGIYDVKYTVLLSPASVVASNQVAIEKTFIKIDQLLCKYDNIFAKIDTHCGHEVHKQKQYRRILDDVDLLIATSVSAANNCDDQTAFFAYQKADDILNNICCEFGMSCTQNFICPQCQ